jgi:hypothetical protein
MKDTRRKGGFEGRIGGMVGTKEKKGIELLAALEEGQSPLKGLREENVNGRKLNLPWTSKLVLC